MVLQTLFKLSLCCSFLFYQQPMHMGLLVMHHLFLPILSYYFLPEILHYQIWYCTSMQYSVHGSAQSMPLLTYMYLLQQNPF